MRKLCRNEPDRLGASASQRAILGLVMRKTVYTIGHSAHRVEDFIVLLEQHAITALVDVRSTPYSRRNPQFNRDDLEASLRKCGIAYQFLGKELGARSEDASCYREGRVQYGLLAETKRFHQGLARLEEGAIRCSIALMCAEKHPLECHRTILVARHLDASGLDVRHIHADGGLEGHGEAMDRLIRRLHLAQGDLFRSREAIIAEAYSLQEERIAYRMGGGRNQRSAGGFGGSG